MTGLFVAGSEGNAFQSDPGFGNLNSVIEKLHQMSGQVISEGLRFDCGLVPHPAGFRVTKVLAFVGRALRTGRRERSRRSAYWDSMYGVRVDRLPVLWWTRVRVDVTSGVMSGIDVSFSHP